MQMPRMFFLEAHTCLKCGQSSTSDSKFRHALTRGRAAAEPGQVGVIVILLDMTQPSCLARPARVPVCEEDFLCVCRWDLCVRLQISVFVYVCGNGPLSPGCWSELCN